MVCKEIDEHTRRTRLAAVISAASNALEVVASDAPFQMIESAFHSNDCIPFCRQFSRVLNDDRCVKLLTSLPPSLLWPGSGLLRKIAEVDSHIGWKPVSEALYAAIKMFGSDKALIARLNGKVNEWNDVSTRPPVPSRRS